MNDADLRLALDALAEIVAKKVVARMLDPEESGFVDQHSSPLGSRRHIRAIRSGQLAGKKFGRRWLARREDVQAFVAQKPSKKPSKPQGASEIGRALGLRVVG